MERVNIRQAKTNLSRLIEEASRGAKPVVRLVPVALRAHVRAPGMYKGEFEPLPPEELERWQW